MTCAGGKDGGGDMQQGQRPIDMGGDTWVEARDVWEEARMQEGADNGGGGGGGME